VYTLTPEGQVGEVKGFSAELTLPDRDIGPIEVPLERAGPGHFAAYGFDIPIAGEWELEAVALVSDVDQVRATTTIDIR
jgi:copper transport protein